MHYTYLLLRDEQEQIGKVMSKTFVVGKCPLQSALSKFLLEQRASPVYISVTAPTKLSLMPFISQSVKKAKVQLILF